ncbi:MAG: RNA methyltransferase [Gemmatimonadetes bacterium]|nr:RNA methyltransferase [Gemmatimonadota bacterium]
MELSRERERLLGRLKTRRTREREGLFLVEGIRSAEEALAAGVRLRFAVVSPRLTELAGGTALRERLVAARVETVDVTDAELGALSDTEAPQGILLVCPQPSVDAADLPSGPLLVLDGVQDPGNVGTLIRAAAAFGVRGVIALDGTVDPYNPKAVRAAAGAIFATRVLLASWEEVAAPLRARGPLLLADMVGSDVASVTASIAPGGDWALVIGGEGAGPRTAVRGAAEGSVCIPMPGGADSLNAGVAGAILLYVLTRESTRG